MRPTGHLCESCQHRQPGNPDDCAVKAAASAKLRRGEKVFNCADYAGEDGSRALQGAARG